MKKIITLTIVSLLSLSVSNLYAQEAYGPNGEIGETDFIEQLDTNSELGFFNSNSSRSSSYAKTNRISGPMILTNITSATGWNCTAKSFILENSILKLKNNNKATFKMFSNTPVLKGNYKIKGSKLNSKTKTKKFFSNGFMKKLVSKVRANRNKMNIKLTYSMYKEGKTPVCKFNYSGNFRK